MHYKITTLVENAVYGRGLQAEHGLSLLIETASIKYYLIRVSRICLSVMQNF